MQSIQIFISKTCNILECSCIVQLTIYEISYSNLHAQLYWLDPSIAIVISVNIRHFSLHKNSRTKLNLDWLNIDVFHRVNKCTNSRYEGNDNSHLRNAILLYPCTPNEIIHISTCWQFWQNNCVVIVSIIGFSFFLLFIQFYVRCYIC